MSKEAKVKEKIGILKFWLGIVVATLLAVVGWAITNFGKVNFWFLALSLFVIICLCVASVVISRHINRHINNLEDL